MLKAVHVGMLREALQMWGPTESFFKPVDSTIGMSLDPVWATGAHQSLLHAVRASCPYLRHKIQRGDVLHAPVGPDRAEQYFHSNAGDFVQRKDNTFAGGATTLLPLGLPPAIHAVCAASVHCTLQQDPTLPDDLQFAVHMSSGTCVDVSLKQLARWRRTALREFKRQVGHLAEEIKLFFTDRYGVSASFLKRMAHPERIAAAAASIAWPDHDLALLACGGARLVGEVEKAFIYRPTHIVPDWSTGELLQTAEVYVQEVMLRPQPKAAEAKVIWEITFEEVDLGYMLGPFSKEQIDQEWGLGKWRCIVRFAIEQRDGSFRVIDNGKSGGHNGSTEAYEMLFSKEITPCCKGHKT